MFKAVIIDDDLRDREVLEMLLAKYCSEEIRIIGHAGDIETAFCLILEKGPNIVFLDIELVNGSGFDLLSKFTEFPFRVVFVTGYDKYAIQAIKFNALDYLLKPVEISELINTVQKLKNAMRLSIDSEIKNLIHNLAHPWQKNNRIAIPVLNGYKMLPVEDILYCEANKEYTNIHCIIQPLICSSINLGEYEDLLTEYSFCRVHHSYLVNRQHVMQYIKGEGGELMIGKDTLIPVSRRKKHEVVDWLKTL